MSIQEQNDERELDINFLQNPNHLKSDHTLKMPNPERLQMVRSMLESIDSSRPENDFSVVLETGEKYEACSKNVENRNGQDNKGSQMQAPPKLESSFFPVTQVSLAVKNEVRYLGQHFRKETKQNQHEPILQVVEQRQPFPHHTQHTHQTLIQNTHMPTHMPRININNRINFTQNQQVSRSNVVQAKSLDSFKSLTQSGQGQTFHPITCVQLQFPSSPIHQSNISQGLQSVGSKQRIQGFEEVHQQYSNQNQPYLRRISSMSPISKITFTSNAPQGLFATERGRNQPQHPIQTDKIIMRYSDSGRIQEEIGAQRQVDVWKSRFSELEEKFQSLKLKEIKEPKNIAGHSKVEALQTEITRVHNGYEELVSQYELVISENNALQTEIQRLNALITQRQDLSSTAQASNQIIREFEKKITKKNDKISFLENKLEKREQEISNSQKEIQSIVEKEALKLSHKSKQKYEEKISQLEDHINQLRCEYSSEVELYQKQIQENNTQIQQLIASAHQNIEEKLNLEAKINELETSASNQEINIKNLKEQISILEEFKRMKEDQTQFQENLKGENYENMNKAIMQELEILRRSNFEREREKHGLKLQYQELECKYQEMEEQFSKKRQENQSFRVHLSDYESLEHENKKMLEMVGKKNSELLELREIVFQKQHHSNQYDILSKENQKMKEILWKKNEELSELSQKLYNEERKVREHELKGTQMNDLRDQSAYLQNLTQAKDADIFKLKQALALLEGNVEEHLFQIESIKLQHHNTLQRQDFEKKQLLDKIQFYQKKFIDFQKIVKQLEEIREKLNFEINHLNCQIQQKNDRICLKEEIEQSLQSKVKEQSKKSLEIDAEVSKANSEVQIISHRCLELEHVMKSKELFIQNLQQEIDNYKSRENKITKDLTELEEMKKRFRQKELSHILFNKYSLNLATNYQSKQIFENKIIYSLKEENKNLLNKLRHTKELERSPGKSEFLSKDNSTQRQQIVKDRLTSFSNKINQLTRYKSQTNLRLNSPKIHSKKIDKEEGLQQQDQSAYCREIEKLKQLVLHMQTQQQYQHHSESKVSQKSLNLVKMQVFYQEEMQYLKSKNKQLEIRVDNQIQVNNNLKESLEKLLQESTNKEAISLYKHENEKLMKTTFELQLKIKDLTKEKEQIKILTLSTLAGSPTESKIHDVLKLQGERTKASHHIFFD